MHFHATHPDVTGEIQIVCSDPESALEIAAEQLGSQLGVDADELHDQVVISWADAS